MTSTPSRRLWTSVRVVGVRWVRENDEQPSETPRWIVAVGSGKGGGGKSTIAVNLAVALARRGHRVGLLDADIHGPDVGVMLGARRRSGVSGVVSLPIAHRQPPKPAEKIPAVERFGVRTFSVGMMIAERQAVTLDGRFAGMLVQQLIKDVAWGPLDVLLLDLPPGARDGRATGQTRRGFLVTTPQEVAQIDTMRMLQFYEAARIPVIGTILNMSYFQCPDCGARHAIWPRHDTPDGPLSFPLLAELPLAPAIANPGDAGQPVVAMEPESATAQLFIAAARRFWERLEGVAASPA